MYGEHSETPDNFSTMTQPDPSNPPPASSSPCDPVESPRSVLTGSFFPNSHNFLVSGGEFTSVTNIYHSSPSVRQDFRMIPLGDLDLRHEIGGDIVHARRRRGYVKRIYHARIEGRNANSTVALYQGQAAEEVWRRELETYSKFRHPNIVQLYGAVTSGDMYATVFHDELIPLKETLSLYRYSPIATVYLLGIFAMDACDADDYLESVTGEWMEMDSTLWIRASTGRLCVELVPSGENYSPLLTNVWAHRLPQSMAAFLKPDAEPLIISALTFDQYHWICSAYMALGNSLPMSAGQTVELGSIMVMAISGNPHLDNIVEVAATVNSVLDDTGWTTIPDLEEVQPVLMRNGWTRFKSTEIARKTLHRMIDCRRALIDAWLSQANYIFERLGITSNYEDYVFLPYITYWVTLLPTKDTNPPGYLFVCPLEDLKSTASASRFRLPEQQAYWAIDPTGADRLSAEDAERLGFPELSFSAHVWESSWDESVYAGLRKFHAGKGFDPTSQDLARHLGVPLYHLAAAGEPLFAHVEEDFSSGENGFVDPGNQQLSDDKNVICDSNAILEAPPACHTSTPAPGHRKCLVLQTILTPAKFGIIFSLGVLWLALR
ncbi:hypothetical protein C8R44DRAFT_760419 [Mycena epipterygia]|nr:hypothetical protein C8R44DRAFT_760419 [Mycena epipterygia]